MRDYFIRRFLLIIPTMLGATLLVFFLTRITPGGPMERAMQAALAAGDKAQKNLNGNLSDEQKEQMAAYYGFDKPFFPAYCIWLGILPREENKQFIKFEKGKEGAPITLKRLLPRSEWKATNAYRTTDATVSRDGKLSASDAGELKGWQTHPEPDKERVVVFRPVVNGILQGNFSVSTSYNVPVLEMIVTKMPVSLFYGLFTFILSYTVCIPLGVVKAIKHRTFLDSVTSILIFIGYAIPGFLLLSLMVVYLAARHGWFPTEGFTSENFDSLSALDKVLDILHHAALPLVSYLVGSFALLTMLVKNNLMDNLAADFVRTAIAKGASYRRAVLGHALRNSMIPVATTLGSITMIFLGGSFLIEHIYNIDGIGQLTVQSMFDRDYPVVLGILTLETGLVMLGNILSDFLVAVTDPRVRFQ